MLEAKAQTAGICAIYLFSDVSSEECSTATCFDKSAAMAWCGSTKINGDNETPQAMVKHQTEKEEGEGSVSDLMISALLRSIHVFM